MSGACDVKTEAEIGVVCLPVSQGSPGKAAATRRWRAGQQPPLQFSERTWPCQHLHFRLAASRTVIITFSFKPFHLWYFITAAAVGN